MWVKICGMTDQEAVDAALAAGADALGFVFSPSVRRLEPEQALQLAARARGRAAVIAVTLHPPQPLIDEIVRLFSPDALQAEQSDFERLRLPQALGRLPVLRAEVAAGGVRILASAATTGPTGVEMEALTAAAVAALTIYDMTKALDEGIVIRELRLESKTGGKSGNFKR